ncbi:unnamed protein product [Gordionus sp. m RMFG-2023]
MLENSPLTGYDAAVIVIYFILILGYFLAGRYMIWLTVGGSLFASNIGSEHFVGLAGSGASSGIGVAAFEFNAAIVLQLLGCLFLPVYIASGANTLPEYMKKRFGGTRIRTYLACLYIILYIFAKISVDLYSGALFIERGLNWNMYTSIFFILFMTVICTVTGGLTAVMYTDTVQTFLIIIGAAVTAFISIKRVGGFQALKYKYMNAIPTGLEETFIANTNSFIESEKHILTSQFKNFSLYNEKMISRYNKGCSLPRIDAWVLLRNAWNSDVPWLGIFLGQTTVSLWYWCTDQMMVQRALAAKSLSHAQGGTIFVGYLKLLPLFLLIIPGMASRVLYTDLVACSDPEKCKKICGNKVSCANIAYPLMAFDILPPGMKGVMFSVMLAALMSDLASVFNSSSTLFTIDIWQKIRKKASVKELMIVGRCFVLVMVAASVAWIPVIESFQGGQLYIYIQSMGSYLAPPIACVFLLAVMWPRCNEQGAFWSLMLGLGIGLIRMFLDLVYKTPSCGNIDTRPALIRVHFLYFAAILFWITSLFCIAISLLTQPLPKKYLIKTTYWTRFANYETAKCFTSNPNSEHQLLNKTQILNSTSYPTANGSKFTKLSTGLNTNGNFNESTNDKIGDHKNKINNVDLIASSHNQILQTSQEPSQSSQSPLTEKNNPQNGKCSKIHTIWMWFLGFEHNLSEQSILNAQNLEAIHAERLEKIQSLSQSPIADFIIKANVVLIISLAIFLMLYFTF